MSTIHHYETQEEDIGKRLDTVLCKLLPDASRSMIQKAIKSRRVTVDGEIVTKTGTPLKNASHRLAIEILPLADLSDTPQNIPLDILHQDSDIVIINKPPGLVVHPGAGISSNTLLNALLFHYPETQNLPRSGIVHRLDKETSGVMVTARTITAYHNLVDALKERTITREYTALVYGHIKQSGSVDAPIRRHRVHRQNMTVHAEGKPAITHYKPVEIIGPFTLLKLRLESGRTHQIRVHMKHIRHHIYGDPTYKTTRPLPLPFSRQALHASHLSLQHPANKTVLNIDCPLADDFAQLLTSLRELYGTR